MAFRIPGLAHDENRLYINERELNNIKLMRDIELET